MIERIRSTGVKRRECEDLTVIDVEINWVPPTSATEDIFIVSLGVGIRRRGDGLTSRRI